VEGPHPIPLPYPLVSTRYSRLA